jgi:hypothetical protein
MNQGNIVYTKSMNAEKDLPWGDANIEWYIPHGAEKRFFTAHGETQVWFTDGGTHGEADFWVSDNPDAAKPAWRKCYLAGAS